MSSFTDLGVRSVTSNGWDNTYNSNELIERSQLPDLDGHDSHFQLVANVSALASKSPVPTSHMNNQHIDSLTSATYSFAHVSGNEDLYLPDYSHPAARLNSSGLPERSIHERSIHSGHSELSSVKLKPHQVVQPLLAWSRQPSRATKPYAPSVSAPRNISSNHSIHLNDFLIWDSNDTSLHDDAPELSVLKFKENRLGNPASVGSQNIPVKTYGSDHYSQQHQQFESYEQQHHPLEPPELLQIGFPFNAQSSLGPGPYSTSTPPDFHERSIMKPDFDGPETNPLLLSPNSILLHKSMGLIMQSTTNHNIVSPQKLNKILSSNITTTNMNTINPTKSANTNNQVSSNAMYSLTEASNTELGPKDDASPTRTKRKLKCPRDAGSVKMKRRAILRTFKSYTQAERDEYERTKYDFICGVPTKRSRECRRNLSCKTHTLEKKSEVFRSKPLQVLLYEEQENSKITRNKRVRVKKYFALKSKALNIQEDNSGFINDEVQSKASSTHSSEGEKDQDSVDFTSERSGNSPHRKVSELFKNSFSEQPEVSLGSGQFYNAPPSPKTKSNVSKLHIIDQKKEFILQLAKEPATRIIDTICYLHYRLRQFESLTIDERCEMIQANFFADEKTTLEN